MPSGPAQRYDFFLSRRGSVAAVAIEVADVLKEKYKVNVEDYDFRPGASFVEAMHEGIKNSRDLLILYTADYEASLYTRKEFTSFVAEMAQSTEERHIIILRCEDVPLRGLLSDIPFQDLVGVHDTQERKRRIIAAAERQSQAAPPPPRPFIGVPPRIASFTGRADELDRLDAILMQDKPATVTQASVRRAAVQGMGGVGKTSLAIEYAHRYRNLYAGVCWCPAETRRGLLNALASLGVTLGAARAEDKGDVEKSAKVALGGLAEHRATWLLIYDNVTSPDEIADLLPPAGAQILITSRFSDWAGLADEVTVDVLSPEEAIAFLQSRAGRSDPGAETLAEAVGYLPLALDHAAAYCKRTQMRFTEYAAKASSLITTAPRGAGYPRSVTATFDLAISEAVTQCALAEPLMAFLAQCAPDPIPMTLVEGAIDDEGERLQALAALTEVSLLKHELEQAVTLHRLVRAVARARSETKGLEQDAAERVLTRLVMIYPEDGYYDDEKSWELCAHLPAPVGEKVIEKVIEKLLDPEHADMARNMNNLAALLAAAGDLASARLLFEGALKIRESVLGPEHPQTAMSLYNLAKLVKEQDDLVGARPLFERALAITEKVFGPEHPQTAVKVDDLADLLQEHGDLVGARPLFERALAITEKVFGPEHQDTALRLEKLARLLAAQGDFVGSRLLFERSLLIYEKAFGPEHPVVASSLRDLADLLTAQGDLTGARPLVERLDAIRKKHASEQSHTATNLDYLAARVARSLMSSPKRLDELGRTEEAKALRERYGLTDLEAQSPLRPRSVLA